MTTLLDVNVLIALLDTLHPYHGTAHHWFVSPSRGTWATCPIVENGVMRILGGASYANSLGASTQVAAYLRILCSRGGHEFWPDEMSFLDADLIGTDPGFNSKSVTDVYLLALAVSKGGRLATFDARVPCDVVKGGKNALLLLHRSN